MALAVLAAVVAVVLLPCGVIGVDPQLGKSKVVAQGSIASILLVNLDYYADPSDIVININCEPNKGVLALEFPADGEKADHGGLLFKPNDGEYGDDFFTFNVSGTLKPGLTTDQINELRSTRVARLTIVKINDPPLPPPDMMIEFTVSPGTATAGKMRRGCYHDGTLNTANECRKEFPGNPDLILPMTQDMDHDQLRFIVTEKPKKGEYIGETDSTTGDFTYTPNSGINAEWDSFKYKITDCPPGCKPEPECTNKDPVGCAETGDITVTILIGNPTGMRAMSKSYTINEDKVLATSLKDPLQPSSGYNEVILERATFNEAGISAADAAQIQLRWFIINPPAHGDVLVLGCNNTVTTACQNGTIRFVYTPDRNFFGFDEFTYRVEDRNNPHPTNELDGRVLIEVIGMPDPPLARGGDVEVAMARLEGDDMANYQEITLEVEEYDGVAPDMWITMTSEIVNGTLYESADFDADGNVIGFKTKMVTGSYYNMTLSSVQDLEFGRLFVKKLYYIPPPITRGLPLDVIRWATMAGSKKSTACSTAVGWVILPGSACNSNNQIQPTARAASNLVVKCAKGFSINPSDDTQCLRCSDGSYAPGLDLPSCSPCEKGRYSNSFTGHEECERCPKNSYADETGSMSCRSCPANLNDPYQKTSITDGPGKDSIFDCVCERKNTTVADDNDRGYYGPAGGQCRPCPSQGARCMDNNMTWPVNLLGFYLQLNHVNHTATEMPCNNRAACPAHDDWDEMRWKPCADGYNGTRCAECWNRCDEGSADNGIRCYPESNPRHEWWNPVRDQWYRFDQECRECPKINSIGLIVGGLIGCILMAPLVFKLSDAIKNLPAINISLSFTQILAIFPKFNIEWPVSMAWIWEKLSFFNFNIQLLAPECIVKWKWIYTYLFTISLPVILLTVLVLALLLRIVHTVFARSFGTYLKERFYPLKECLSRDHMCNYHNMCQECTQRPKDQQPNPGLIGPPCGKGYVFWRSKQRYRLGMFLTKPSKREQFIDMIKHEVRMFLVFLKIGYIFLATTSLNYFDCVGNDAIGKGQYLDADPTLECYSWNLPPDQDDTWPRLFPLAVCALLLYPIGIFVAFGSLLYSVRKSLDNKAAKQMVGALYFRYKPRYFYWEMAIISRKLIIVLCTIIFSADTPANGLRQALLGMLVLLIALLCHMYAYPFDRKNLNHLESATIAATFFSLFVGLAFLSNKMSSGFSRFMEVCQLIVMGISMFACGYYILLDLFPDFRSKYANYWEERRSRKHRKEKERERKRAAKEGKSEVSIGGYKKVMEFRWRAALGAKASKLLTSTGARILVEFIENDKTLGDVINEGRPADKKLPVPVDAHGNELSKKEAVRQCFEELSNFIHDEDDLAIHKQERQYIYECFRPNVRNVVLEGLSREDKETTDRLKAFLQMVMNVGNEEDDKREPLGGLGGLAGLLSNKGKGKEKKEGGDDDGAHKKLQIDDDDDSEDEEGSAAVAPLDNKPLLTGMKSSHQ